MTRKLWTAKEISLATNGTTTSDWEVTGVSIDSRSIERGDLFIALQGERFDGHDYVEQSLKSGAEAAMVSYIPEDVKQKDHLIVVDDTTEGMTELGIYRRLHTKAKIAGVTGSVGKTSTKEMLYLALQSQGKTHANKGNLNNHLGVPLSLSRMEKECDYGVFEMGMNAPGEIAYLTNMVKPDVSIITCIDAVHLEFFESVKEIAKAKAEIFFGMQEGATAILNHDNNMYQYLASLATKAKLNIVSFGTTADATFQMTGYQENGEGCEITALYQNKEFTYSLGIKGKHQALNSVAVLAAVDALGGNYQLAAKKLASFSAQEGRGKRYHLSFDKTSFTLIDDSYNASPIAMKAAIQQLDISQKKGRTIAVLGDMLELGEDALELHKDLAGEIVENSVDLVFTAGDFMKAMYDTLPESTKGKHFHQIADLKKEITKVIQSNDIVLIKGSHGSKIYEVVDHLLENCQKQDAI